MKKIETILHPVRFKIIQKFLDRRNKTAKELAQVLSDIPQATLYRQLDTLVKAQVLQVVEENQIRGTVEKVYTLNLPAAIIDEEELKNLSKEEHLHYFMIFTAQLVNDFDSYLQKDNIDYRKDGVGYRQNVFHLSDEEFLQFTNEIGKVYKKYLQFRASPDRTPRLFSNIIIPDYRSVKKDDHE